MKRCPNCSTQYTDDTLLYCLQDGSPLNSVTGGEPPTQVLDEMPTISSGRVNRNTFPNDAAAATRFETQRKGPGIGAAVGVTVLIMLAVFAVAGLAAWMVMRNRAAQPASETVAINISSGNTKSPSPSPKPSASPKPTDTAAALAPDEYKRIVDDVKDRLDNWASKTEDLDLDEHMANYADRVDYYQRSGVSRDVVRADRQRAFAKFTSMSIQLSNATVTPNATGDRANVTIDKEWQFESDDDRSCGKVKQSLALQKIAGEWLITSEKDLRVLSRGC